MKWFSFQVCHVFRIGKMLPGGNSDTGKRGSLISYVNSFSQYKRPHAVGVLNISKIITKRWNLIFISFFCSTVFCFCCGAMGSSINDVTQFWTIFDPLYHHCTVYVVTNAAVTKSLPPSFQGRDVLHRLSLFMYTKTFLVVMWHHLRIKTFTLIEFSGLVRVWSSRLSCSPATTRTFTNFTTGSFEEWRPNTIL